jgi:hypothetical protein
MLSIVLRIGSGSRTPEQYPAFKSLACKSEKSENFRAVPLAKILSVGESFPLESL